MILRPPRPLHARALASLNLNLCSSRPCHCPRPPPPMHSASGVRLSSTRPSDPASRFVAESHPPAPVHTLIRVENRTSRPVCGRVLPDATAEVGRTRWLTLQTLTYTNDPETASDPDAVKWRKWDRATRTTSLQKSKTDAEADAVAVFARIRAQNEQEGHHPRVLLVQQYRPAVDAVTVELPAGLIDSGETPADAALRELREETGYEGVVASVLPPAPLSPGLSDEAVALVVVDIIPTTNASATETDTESAAVAEQHGDGAPAATNYLKPQAQNLDDSENIHVVSVPVARLQDALEYMADVQGLKIMHAVWTLGLGVALGTVL